MFIEKYEQLKAKIFRAPYMKDRNIDELIGLVKGVLADDVVNEQEASFILDWIEKHFDEKDLNNYPINIIHDRLVATLKDNKLTQSEAEDLKKLFTMFIGGKPISEQVADMTSTLPLCKPAPDIVFDGKTFCFTGAFTIGTRTQCEALVKSKGGKTSKSITKKTNYLVVGIIGSEAWIHTTYGRKIEKAVEYREKGLDISIVSEEHFIKFL